jgi:hypothetical protein
MIKVLERLFGKVSSDLLANNHARSRQRKRAQGAGDFRAVEIAPSRVCCEAARQASRQRYLLSKAPRMPLMGCTMPLSCSCMFRKNADRRDGDRRLLGSGTSRWFAGVESRKLEARRSSKT